MNIIGIIPCRLNSSRLPDKPLKKILGMSLIEHCYRRTSSAIGVENTFIATCDKQIKDHAKLFNANVIMTSKNHKRATTRTYEALLKIEKKFNNKINNILMVQGDEPMIKIKDLKKLSNIHLKNGYGITNLISIIKDLSLFENPNYVKIVKNKKNELIYLSREPIPSSKISKIIFKKYQQVGVIAFKRAELYKFNNTISSDLEKIESIDMNRCIENKIIINSYAINYQTIGVDTPKDLKLVQNFMKIDKDFVKYGSI